MRCLKEEELHLNIMWQAREWSSAPKYTIPSTYYLLKTLSKIKYVMPIS